jgi:hypothetical protein
MKKVLFIFATFVLLLILILTSYSSKAQILEDAENNIKETAKDSNNDASLKTEYNLDIREYIKEKEDQIANNEQIIADYIWEMKNQRKDIIDKYLSKLTELDQKNNALKEQLNKYILKGETNWQLFIRDFNIEMDILAQEIASYSKLNTK